MEQPKITFIDETEIKNKRVLLRLDLNVTLNPDSTIADDMRIRQSLPTINFLAQNQNKIIIVSHLGQPKERDLKLSLRVIVEDLQKLLPNHKITLVDDFGSADKTAFTNQTEGEILVLENIRFYPEEKTNDPVFAQKLASLADVYVNDAFGVCHRNDTSVVGVPRLIPAYGGLLLKKEVDIISKTITNPQKPLLAIIGGAKISTKINLIGKLLEMADYLLIGGGLANTFLMAQGYNIGQSINESDQVENAKRILEIAKQRNKIIILPSDVVINDSADNQDGEEVKKISEVPSNKYILDIGPETQAKFGGAINKAKTIIWNGPLGYIENPAFRRGSDFIFYTITQNEGVTSIVGGGDTIAAISKKEYLDKITHISTGGGAMLEFIEKGTLSGIEVLKH